MQKHYRAAVTRSAKFRRSAPPAFTTVPLAQVPPVIENVPPTVPTFDIAGPVVNVKGPAVGPVGSLCVQLKIKLNYNICINFNGRAIHQVRLISPLQDCPHRRFSQ